MSGFLMADAVTGIFNFLKSAFKNMNFDVIFGIGLGLMGLFVIIGFIRMKRSYEQRTIKNINKVNRYLLQHPSITEDNLAEFHKLLQKMPRRIRDRWQLYILERDGLPSRYLTAEYCVRRPLASSVLVGIKKQIKMSAIVLSIITFIFGFGYAYATAAGDIFLEIIYIIMYSCATPMFIFLIATLFNMIIQFKFSTINAKLYDIFGTFVRNINRAVATMPDAIDYQILFTQKEIDEGIPVLREYLEKQKLEEQQLLEQSKYAAISHSPYDFSELGVDGEQLISRAVNESENFLMKKIEIQNEIQEYEKKLAQAQDNMDEIEKEANRKIQTIKENLERLDKAISETTNRVEINYNRRQIKDEMEKKAAIEKDLKSLLAKEQVTVNECNVEIQKRKDLIEQDKDQVEVALKSEYNTFAVKVYDTLSDKLDEEQKDVIKEYQNQIVDLNARMQTLSREIENKDAIIQEKDLLINTMQNTNMAAAEMLSTNNFETTPQQNLMTEENAVQQQQQTYYDQNGNAIDYSGYYDQNGNLIDYSQYYDQNGNYIGPTQEEWDKMYGAQAQENQEPQQQETPAQEPEQQVQEEPETPYVPENPELLNQSTIIGGDGQAVESASETQEQPVAEAKKEPAVKKPRPMSRAKSATKAKPSKSAAQKKEQVKTTSRKKANTIKVADESLKSAKDEDDFEEIQKQIDRENEKLKQNKDELQVQIDKAIGKMETSQTETSKATNIKRIKGLIEQLKQKAKEAKANGASKEEIKSINSSVAELVEVITKFSSKK